MFYRNSGSTTPLLQPAVNLTICSFSNLFVVVYFCYHTTKMHLIRIQCESQKQIQTKTKEKILLPGNENCAHIMYVMHFQKVGYPPASDPCVACDLRSQGISAWRIIGDEASIIRRVETPWCRVGCRKEKIYNNDKQLQLFRLKYCHIVWESVLCLTFGEF